MKEAEIRKKVIAILTADRWVCWFPHKARWAKESDIFGVYDLILAKKNRIKFIQLTTLSNIRAREKKVKKFLTKHNLSIYSEVWGYNKKKDEFKIIRIYGGKT